MEYMRLLKLLYLADRLSLQSHGRTITHDRFVAMDQGPVLSGVYDLIKGSHLDSPEWSHFFQLDRYRIRLIQATGVGNLSRSEIDILNKIFDQWQGVDQWDIVEELHTLPEWIKNKPSSKSSQPIPLRDILTAVGLEEEADEILEDERVFDELDRFFKKAE